MSVERFVLTLTNEQAAVVCYSREIILSCSPYVEEKTDADILAYYCNGKLCYMHAEENGGPVHICFEHGYEIDDPYGLLQSRLDTSVKCLSYNKKKEIDAHILREFVQQAMLLNTLTKPVFNN